MGYPVPLWQNAPPPLTAIFCGVGNPFQLGEIKPNEWVLDIGCGAGFDLYVASTLVGEGGKVCGLDLTTAMVTLATTNLRAAGVANFEVNQVDSEKIPYPELTFTTVISNGVINLFPDKPACLAEIYRVLRPGGQLLCADVVLEKELPIALAADPEAWSQ